MNPRQPLTIERVTHESRYFLNDFVHGMLEADGVDGPTLEALQGAEAPRELPPEHVREIKRAIRDIMDAEEKDQKLNAQLSLVPAGKELEVTRNVSRRLFDDGVFNWGRVMGLFYVAYRLCKKAVNVVGLLRSLIETIMDFMRENVINWIFQQGGWNGLLDFLRRSTKRNILIFGGLAVAAAGVIIYKNWSIFTDQ
ncbi:apoptosis regulator BAX [Elysia marginata]|uniref:Apoptosis regulator BAX n=1 Tax=Elysia marginata TaxID=1093978 RepID=A0AAV4J4G9_9GAST|nr:apoptosis regulator BAX [Elysia marginata]